jgi:hypothetical protein
MWGHFPPVCANRISMTEKVDQDLKASLEKILNAGLGDDCMKAVKKQTDSILYDMLIRLTHTNAETC